MSDANLSVHELAALLALMDAYGGAADALARGEPGSQPRYDRAQAALRAAITRVVRECEQQRCWRQQAGQSTNSYIAQLREAEAERDALRDAFRLPPETVAAMKDAPVAAAERAARTRDASSAPTAPSGPPGAPRAGDGGAP